MTDPRIIVVNTTIAQTAEPTADYKTQIIIDCNHLTFDRISTYASGGYSAIPTGSLLKTALDAAFSTSVKPATVKVGRAKGAATYAPSGVADANEYGFTITVKDGYSLNETYTTGVGEDAQDIATALKAQFDLDSDITDHVSLTVSGTGADAVLVIALVSGDDDFTVTNFTGDYTLTGTASEAATDTLEAIGEIDNGWTFITSTNHTPSYQIAMAAATEVLAEKMYFTSTDLEEAYATWDQVSIPDSNDVGGLFRFNAYSKSHCQYHHLADNYIEMARISEYSWMEPGSTDWQYTTLSGYGLAQIADLSRPLNTAELIQLKNRYTSSITSMLGLSGSNPVVGGYDGLSNRMADGVRIEVLHWSYRATQVIKQRIATILQNSRKVGMNDADINRVRSAITTWLDTQVSVVGSTLALDPIRPYKLTMPKAADISFEDKVAGILSGINLIAYSDASVGKVVVDLTVTFNNPSEV